MDTTSKEWIADCRHWRGRVLTGLYAHWCFDWDGLPIDETTPEWPCTCALELQQDHLKGRVAVLLIPFVNRRITPEVIEEMAAVLNNDPEVQRMAEIIAKASP